MNDILHAINSSELGRNVNLEGRKWTAKRAIEKLALLSGARVNLIPVLQDNLPHHAHYGEDEYGIAPWEEDKSWTAEKITKEFPMIDFTIYFELSPSDRKKM